jgi:methylenetetrahydrofolate dehydrogenase (NADP+)/methenyltetrahydrofolate cyclohydrolase
MTTVIDGKKIRSEILTKIKKEIASLSFQPIFCDILVGEDPSSMQYVKMKAKTAESVGIKFHNAFFPDSINTEDLVREIKILNKIPNMCGIIVQLPLPGTLDRRKILDAIDPRLDVDCLGTVASEKFYKGEINCGFPTALACMKLLDSTGVSLQDKKIAVLGQGDLVGKPVAALLQFRGFHPDIIRSKTENKEEIIKNADILISGMGKGKYITGNMIKRGAILIDAGTSESNGGIVGDIDFESVKDIADFISPVPGGVGPVTVAMLLNNVLNVAKKKYE